MGGHYDARKILQFIMCISYKLLNSFSEVKGMLINLCSIICYIHLTGLGNVGDNGP